MLFHHLLTQLFPIPFPYLLKTSEILPVFQCFQGIEKGCIGNKWVNKNHFLHLHRQPLWECWNDFARQYEELHDSKEK